MNDRRRDETPYHTGELAVQKKAGVEELAARIGRIFRPDMPNIAQAFLAAQPWVVLGATDHAGRAWATLVEGPPGFARALDERTVVLDTSLAQEDPLAAALIPGNEAGLLAIEPATRKRMRMNGRIVTRSPLTISTDQVYSNCPKYIQARTVVFAPRVVSNPSVDRPASLDASAKSWIETADTFFIASGVAEHGADVSHRGGNPGFAHVDGNRISWPDYVGNMMFNTLGNLERNPAAGLLFVDFETGDLLQLSGSATIDWLPERASTFAGAERIIDLDVGWIVRRRSAIGLRFGTSELSPFNP